MIKELNFTAWAIVGDGEKLSSQEEIGVGRIHGYQYDVIQGVIETGSLWMCLSQCKINPPKDAVAVNFVINNVKYKAGAYYTMDVAVIDYDTDGDGWGTRRNEQAHAI